MRDEKYTPEVGAWLKGREVEPGDSKDTARRVATRLPHVRQRSRWWPFPVLHRRSTTSDSTYKNTIQHNPVTATNGHTPTVIGRTSSMLSPAKAITAGAIVFAIGGVFLVAQPFDQPSSAPGAAPGAATGEAPPNMEAAEVTGRALMKAERRDASGDFVMIDMGGTVNTGAVDGVWSTGDPRLNGSVTRTVTWHWNPVSGIAIDSHTYELTNDGGSWLGEGNGYLTNLREDPVSTRWVALTGRDGYEGLSAMVVLETGNVLEPSALNLKGVIFPSQVPEVPEPYADD